MRDLPLNVFMDDSTRFQEVLYSICCREGKFHVLEWIGKETDSIVLGRTETVAVLVSVNDNTLLGVNEKAVKEIEHDQVLNLNDNGERWEGDILQNEPFGWGVFYDGEGEKAYEGFRLGNMNMCYGIQYYADIQKIEYEGEWVGGKRWGRGIQYDRNGVVVYEGVWLNDGHLEKRLVLDDENQVLHNRIEELIVSDASCNGGEWSVLDLSCMPILTVLQVGDECFENVEELKLIGLKKLERVMIGKNSFTRRKWHCLKSNRHFYLKDCEKLKELKMGCETFKDYSVCEIANVPSLEVIAIGELNEKSSNFYWVSQFELKSAGDGMK